MVTRRYRARYGTQDALVTLFDAVLGWVVRSGRSALPKNPQRILIANAGHLGDAVISTAIVRVIKSAFPNASVGFLTGNYSKAVIDGHPLIDRAHYMDHWLASRTKDSKLRKAVRYYFRDRPRMVRELRQADYDIALDLHAWLPNFVPLLWRARIPARLGFRRVGFAPLLTHPQDYHYDRRHELEHQLDLLRPWDLPRAALERAQPNLAPVAVAMQERVAQRLGLGTRYHVLHPASSTPTRDWTVEGWSTLARSIVSSGSQPVITGMGDRDAAIAADICRSAPGAVNAIDRLNWSELMALLSAAEVVYSVETSIGHAAAALGRRVVSVYGGMADPRHWAPVGATVVTHSLPCSPCINKHGCAHRSCLLLTTAQDIERARDEAASADRSPMP